MLHVCWGGDEDGSVAVEVKVGREGKSKCMDPLIVCF